MDIGYQFLIMDIMKQRKDTTIFTSIHDMNMAMQYCDYLIALKDGRVYCTGAPKEVLTQENMKNLFQVHAEIWDVPGSTPHICYLGAVQRERK